MVYNRYNSHVLVTFEHSSTNLVDTYEYFDDLQMAYMRIVEYIKQNPGNWDNLSSFTEFANTLDENTLTLLENERCIVISKSTTQIIVEYISE
jgi:hypothetical protein